MSKRKSDRRKRSGGKWFFLLLIVLVVLILAGVFQLNNIVVRGNVHVTADEVMEVVLSRPTGGNTILAKLFNTGRNINGSGFIDELNAEITDRSTLTVTVTEHDFTGVVHEDDSYWYIVTDGTVQAKASDRATQEDVPEIEGLEFSSELTLGSMLPIKGSKVFSLLDSLKRITKLYEIIPEKVIFAEDYTMSLIYGEVTVKIGDGTNLEGKIKELASILEEMNGEYSGTLHLEKFEKSGNPIVFDQN